MNKFCFVRYFPSIFSLSCNSFFQKANSFQEGLVPPPFRTLAVPLVFPGFFGDTTRKLTATSLLRISTAGWVENLMIPLYEPVERFFGIFISRVMPVGSGRVMPWDYHAAHLFKTVGEVVVAHLGQAGQEAIEEALADFAGHYGAEAAEILASYRDADFDRLPG